MPHCRRCRPANGLVYRLIAVVALCLAIGTVPRSVAQNVSVSKEKIASSESAALNKLLADAQDALNRMDYPAAVQNLQDYLAKQPHDADAHFQLGYAYTAMQRGDDAKAEYQKAISLDPKMQAAYLDLGLTLLAKDPAAAVEPLQKAVELAPDQEKPKYLLGTALEQSNQLQPAIAQYQAAKNLDGKDYEVRFALGRALLKVNRPTDAEPEFRSALALQPDSPLAHWGLAQCYAARKTRQGEADELALYLKAQPGDANAHVERASALLDLGKNDDALAELASVDPAAQMDLPTLMQRARIDFQLKHYDDALDALQKAQPLAPKDANIPALVGQIDLQKKDYPDAIRALALAFQMYPQDNDVLAELVVAQYSNKNCAATLQGLDLLAMREPLPPASWFVRADCYDKMGQAADALAAYQMFLQANKDQNSDMYFAATDRVRFLKRALNKR